LIRKKSDVRFDRIGACLDAKDAFGVALYAASATEEDIHPDARGTEVLFTYPLFVLDELCRHSIKAGNDRYLFIKLTEKLRR
jgi:hypothetical protein